MAREVHPPRIYESPLPFSRSSNSQQQPSTTRAPLGLSSGFLSNTTTNANQPQALGLDLAKTLLEGKKINKSTTTKLSLNERKEKKGEKKGKGKEASSTAGWEESEEDDEGFGNLTRESSKDLPGSAIKMKKSAGGGRKKVSGGGLGGSTRRRTASGGGKGKGPRGLMSPPSSQGARGGGGGEEVTEKSVDLVVQMQPSSYIPPTPSSSQPLPHATAISTTPSYSPGRRAPSLPAPASPSFLFPSSSQRRAISQAPPPKSPLKALTTSRSRKRTVSSRLGGNGATSTTPAPSPNPRARKQPKSTLSASSSQPLPRTTAFTLSTPVASSSGSKRGPPRTDRPIASKSSASFPFISSSSQPNLSTSRKKSTLSQSTSSSSYNRRKSAPARGLSVTVDHPDEGTPLGSQTLPDTPPPPRSPGDDPILLKGRERVRRYEYEEGDESVLMGDEEGVDELDMMMGESSQRERSVKTEEEMGDLSMQRSSMGGAAEDEDDEEGEDSNITYNPQASPSTSRTRSSLVAGRRSSRPSPPPPAPVAIQQPLFLPTTTNNAASTSSLARPSPLSLFLTTASSSSASSSSAHSTPLLQRTVASSSSSSSLLPIQPTPSTQHQTPQFPPSGYTPSLLNPYTPAPALSPYTFHQPGTPESYSGSEDDHEERMLNRERSDSFLAEMVDGEAEGWARKMRSSLSPDSSDHEEGQQGWGGEEGMDFGRDDGDGEVRWRDEEEEVVVEREKSLEIEVEKPVEHQEEEEEQQELVASQSQPRPSFANLDRSSPVPTTEHDADDEEEEGQIEPSIPVLALAQDDKEPSAAPEDGDASPPPSDDGHDEQQDQPEQTSFEQDQDSSFLVVVEQKSLAEEIAEAETPEQSPVEEKRFDLQRGDEGAEDSFSEYDNDHDASFAGGFDSDSFGGSQHDEEEEEEVEEEQWEDEGDAMDEDEAEELYFNESSQDLLDAAEHSFLSTVTSPSPSPIKSVHMSSPAKLNDRSHLQPIAASSTPSRQRRSASPHASTSASTPFLSNLPTIQQLADNEADVTHDYVVELNDVSSQQSQSDEEEAPEEANHSFVSTASIVDSPTPSSIQQRPSLGPKRLSLQTITQLDTLFKNRSSLSPSLASGGSPSPRFAAFPSTTTNNSTYFPVASSSTSISSSHSDRRPSVSSSTGGGGSAYPSISDVMAAKQEILAKAFEKRSAGGSQQGGEQGEVLRAVGGSGGGEAEGEGAEETYIKISSNDPREAARATAFLKMFHDYVETDLNSSTNPNASFTSAASGSSSRRRRSISKHQTPRRTSTSSRRRSSIHMGDVSMMSAPELLMEAEQEIADELDEDASDEEEEEELAIPGSFQSSSMLSLEERSFVKEEKKKTKKGKGKGRESVKLTTRDRAWGTTEWRCLMGCLDAVGGKRGEVDEEVVVGRFLETMGLKEEELEGEWDRSKLLIRIASIQQRRLNELKTGGTPGRRRRSHNNPQRAFLSPNKASNMSIGSITSTHSPRRPANRSLGASSSLSALPSKKPTFAGKLFGFLSGGWLASSASAPNVVVAEQQQEEKKQMKETVRPQPPSNSSSRQQVVEMAEVPRVRLSQPDAITSSAILASPISLPSSSSWRASSNVVPPSRRRASSSSSSHPPPPPAITLPSTTTSQRAPIAIPQRPSTAPIKIKPRSSNVMSPKPKVLEMVRSFESVRSLGEEEMERVRALERKGSRGSLRSASRGGEEEE